MCDKEEVVSLLTEVVEHLENVDYNSWYKANTMLSYNEWRSKLTLELITKLQGLASDLNKEEEEKEPGYNAKELKLIQQCCNAAEKMLKASGVSGVKFEPVLMQEYLLQ